MSEKRRLGKGLGALIPEAISGTAEINEIDLKRIKPNPFQPRQAFEDEKMAGLVSSIREHGILQAVIVAPEDQGPDYILVAGERRCRAARIAGLSKVPAVIRTLDRKSMLEIALIENLQREDLNPVEEAEAYQRLMKEFNYTQEELANRLGRSRPAIANSMRLLSLAQPLLEMLSRGELNPGQARPLIAIEDPAQQHEFAKKIVAEGLSARQVEKLIARPDIRRQKKQVTESTGDPLQFELQLQMQRSLGTKVKIRQAKNGGTIEIYYYSEDDLERLVAKLLPAGV